MYHFVHSFSIRLLLGAFLVFGGALAHAQEAEVKGYIGSGLAFGQYSSDACSDAVVDCDSVAFNAFAGIEGHPEGETGTLGLEVGYFEAQAAYLNVGSGFPLDVSTIYLAVTASLPLSDRVSLASKLGAHQYEQETEGTIQGFNIKATAEGTDLFSQIGLNIDLSEEVRIQPALQVFRFDEEGLLNFVTNLVIMF